MIAAPLYTEQWDYTEHAQYYYARPNYSAKAIDELVEYVGFCDREDCRLADIGAGTGNLSIMLAERGFRPVAVEPNWSMMRIGMEQATDLPVSWKLGTAERTGLEAASVDWITFGSSFGTCDRQDTFDEMKRIVKSGGYFTCMWNHRDLVNDPIQADVEKIMKRNFPAYSHGSRREDQRPVLEDSGLFSEIHTIEDPFMFRMSMAQYKDGWRSVKNRFWDSKTEEGRRTLDRILGDIESAYGRDTLDIPYTTRIWVARMAG